MNHGPVLSHVLDLVSDGDAPGDDVIWGAAILAPAANYEVQLKADPGDDELSEAEIAVLEEVWEALGHEGRWELVELAHQLPNGKTRRAARSPISYRDILAAQGIDDEEIEAIEEEICGVAATQDFQWARVEGRMVDLGDAFMLRKPGQQNRTPLGLGRPGGAG